METTIIQDWFNNLHVSSHPNIWNELSIQNRLLPKISLVIPVYNTKETWLRECLDSVYNQIYPYWELCICNNGSTEPHVAKILEYYSQDPTNCVKIINITENENGAVGTNAAISLATGDYIGLLDSDDVLMPTALFRIVQVLNNNPLLKILYTDEIFINSEGIPYLPFFKPEFNADLLCFLPYFSHLTVYKRDILPSLHFSGGSYDYDLVLRTSEIVECSHIQRVPFMVYKYRIYPESTSHSTYQTCREGGLISLQEHLNRVRPGAVASMTDTYYKVILADNTELKINGKDMIKPYSDYPNTESYLLSNLENL